MNIWVSGVPAIPQTEIRQPSHFLLGCREQKTRFNKMFRFGCPSYVEGPSPRKTVCHFFPLPSADPASIMLRWVKYWNCYIGPHTHTHTPVEFILEGFILATVDRSLSFCANHFVSDCITSPGSVECKTDNKIIPKSGLSPTHLCTYWKNNCALCCFGCLALANGNTWGNGCMLVISVTCCRIHNPVSVLN